MTTLLRNYVCIRTLEVTTVLYTMPRCNPIFSLIREDNSIHIKLSRIGKSSQYNCGVSHVPTAVLILLLILIK